MQSESPGAGRPARWRRVGCLLYPGFDALDAYVPLQILGTLTKEGFGLVDEVLTIACQPGPVPSSIGVESVARVGLDACPVLDVLVIPGGIGSRVFMHSREGIEWLGRQVEEGLSHILALSTGSHVIAKLPMFRGERMATSPMLLSYSVKLFPEVEWVRGLRWVRSSDGRLWTTQGGGAGAEGMLALVAEVFGPEAADSLTEFLELTVAWRDPLDRAVPLAGYPEVVRGGWATAGVEAGDVLSTAGRVGSRTIAGGGAGPSTPAVVPSSGATGNPPVIRTHLSAGLPGASRPGTPRSDSSTATGVPVPMRARVASSPMLWPSVSYSLRPERRLGSAPSPLEGGLSASVGADTSAGTRGMGANDRAPSLPSAEGSRSALLGASLPGRDPPAPADEPAGRRAGKQPSSTPSHAPAQQQPSMLPPSPGQSPLPNLQPPKGRLRQAFQRASLSAASLGSASRRSRASGSERSLDRGLVSQPASGSSQPLSLCGLGPDSASPCTATSIKARVNALFHKRRPEGGASVGSAVSVRSSERGSERGWDQAHLRRAAATPGLGQPSPAPRSAAAAADNDDHPPVSAPVAVCGARPRGMSDDASPSTFLLSLGSEGGPASGSGEAAARSPPSRSGMPPRAPGPEQPPTPGAEWRVEGASQSLDARSQVDIGSHTDLSSSCPGPGARWPSCDTSPHADSVRQLSANERVPPVLPHVASEPAVLHAGFLSVASRVVSRTASDAGTECDRGTLSPRATGGPSLTGFASSPTLAGELLVADASGALSLAEAASVAVSSPRRARDQTGGAAAEAPATAGLPPRVTPAFPTLPSSTGRAAHVEAWVATTWRSVLARPMAHAAILEAGESAELAELPYDPDEDLRELVDLRRAAASGSAMAWSGGHLAHRGSDSPPEDRPPRELRKVEPGAPPVSGASSLPLDLHRSNSLSSATTSLTRASDDVDSIEEAAGGVEGGAGDGGDAALSGPVAPKTAGGDVAGGAEGSPPLPDAEDLATLVAPLRVSSLTGVALDPPSNSTPAGAASPGTRAARASASSLPSPGRASMGASSASQSRSAGSRTPSTGSLGRGLGGLSRAHGIRISPLPSSPFASTHPAPPPATRAPVVDFASPFDAPVAPPAFPGDDLAARQASGPSPGPEAPRGCSIAPRGSGGVLLPPRISGSVPPSARGSGPHLPSPCGSGGFSPLVTTCSGGAVLASPRRSGCD